MGMVGIDAGKADKCYKEGPKQGFLFFFCYLRGIAKSSHIRKHDVFSDSDIS